MSDVTMQDIAKKTVDHWRAARDANKARDAFLPIAEQIPEFQELTLRNKAMKQAAKELIEMSEEIPDAVVFDPEQQDVLVEYLKAEAGDDPDFADALAEVQQRCDKFKQMAAMMQGLDEAFADASAGIVSESEAHERLAGEFKETDISPN